MDKLLLTCEEASAYAGLALYVIKNEVQKGNIDFTITDKKKRILISRPSLEARVAEMCRCRETIPSASTARKEYYAARKAAAQ